MSNATAGERPGVGVKLVRWFNHRFPWHHLKPSLAKRALRRLPPGEGRRVYDGIQGNLRMELDLALKYEQQIYLNCRDVVLLDVLRRTLRPGDTMVDCGANLGLLTLVGATCVRPGGKVVAFEPSPRTAARLRENIRLNRCANEVDVVESGCWHERSRATLHDFEGETHDTSSLSAGDDKSVASTVEIETLPVDDIVKPPVKLVKVDVEGADFNALRGAERLLFTGPPPHILVEVNVEACRPFGYHPNEMVTWILERRPEYQLRLIRSRTVEKTNAQAVAKYLEENPDKAPNLWFAPA